MDSTDLGLLSTTNVSDAMDKLGLNGVLENIMSVNSINYKIFGNIVTVKLTDNEIPNPSHLGIDAINIAKLGEIIVMANDGRKTMACWGGILSTAAKQKNIAGVIIDGACRDIDEIDNIQFPVYSKGLSLRTARNRVYQEEINSTINIGSIELNPNDFIFADMNGVIVIPQKEKEVVLLQAIKLMTLENEMIKKIGLGENISSIDQDYKYNDILKMKDN